MNRPSALQRGFSKLWRGFVMANNGKIKELAGFIWSIADLLEEAASTR
jgi:hypothetical protein